MMIHLYDQNLIYCTLNGLASYLYTFHGKAAHASGGTLGGCQCTERGTAHVPWNGLSAAACDPGCPHPRRDPKRRGSTEYRAGGGQCRVLDVRALDLDYMMDVVKVDCAAGGALAQVHLG